MEKIKVKIKVYTQRHEGVKTTHALDFEGMGYLLEWDFTDKETMFGVVLCADNKFRYVRMHEMVAID